MYRQYRPAATAVAKDDSEKREEREKERKNSDNKLVVKSTCKHANVSSHAMHVYCVHANTPIHTHTHVCDSINICVHVRMDGLKRSDLN